MPNLHSDETCIDSSITTPSLRQSGLCTIMILIQHTFGSIGHKQSSFRGEDVGGVGVGEK